MGSYWISRTSRIHAPGHNIKYQSKEIAVAYLLTGGFIGWMFITNPGVILGRGDRNWIVTYGQLYVLMWLGSELLDPSKQKILMAASLATSVLTAISAITQTQSSNFADMANRSAGLSYNANESAMYLNIGLAFAVFFFIQFKHWQWLRAIVLIVAGVLIFGVAATRSRTGFITMSVMLLLIVYFYRRPGPDRPKTLKRRQSLMIILAVVAVVLVIMPKGYWVVIDKSFVTMREIIVQPDNPGLLASPDISVYVQTFNKRIDFWQTALELWRTQPIQGIGTGQYEVRTGVAVHNMYLTALVENGVVGFALFIGFLVVTLRQLWVITGNLALGYFFA